jgi:hypothetical protein
MKLLYTAFCWLLFTGRACAQWVNIGPGGEALSSVSFADASNGWICGANAVFYQTHDGGKSWTTIPDFYNFKPHNNMLAVAATASDMVVLLWQLPSLATPSVIYHSAYNSYGSYGYSAATNGLGDFNNLSLRQLATGFAVGNGGALAMTRDKGFSYASLTSGTQNDLFAADSPDGNVAFVAGSKGTLRRASGPAFTNWQALNTTTTARLTSVWFVTSLQGYLVGDGGTALRTIDGGMTWTAMSVGTNADLNAVRFVDANIGFIAGDLGTLLLTTDGGKTWKPEASYTYETLSSIHATTDGSAIWVAGGGGTVLKREKVVLASQNSVALAAWQVYPNPFKNVLTVNLPAQSEAVTVKLLDLTGRVIVEQLLAASNSQAACQLSVPDTMAEGTYVIQLSVPSGVLGIKRLMRLL